MSESHLQELSREDLLAVVRDLFVLSEEQQAVIHEQGAAIGEQRARIEHLEDEVCGLRGGAPPSQAQRETPSLVKPNRKRKKKSPREEAAERWRPRNHRRAELIHRRLHSPLSAEEEAELGELQQEADEYLEQVAPLPTDHLKALLERGQRSAGLRVPTGRMLFSQHQ